MSREKGAVERIDTIVPIGKLGDGAVRLRYMPDPPEHRTKFEIFYDWGDSEDTVYIGNKEHAERLVDALTDMIEAAESYE